MPRKQPPKSSDEIAREIERLQQQRVQLETVEHTRRGQLVRDYLTGSKGSELRELLDPLVSPSDRHLFGLASAPRASRPHIAAGE